jgi:hypothetical protein
MFGLFYNSLLGGAFVIASAIILTLNQQRRDVVLYRLNIRRRRASGSNTPPRSLSPDKKEKAIDFNPLIRFPPTRRWTLTQDTKPVKTKEEKEKELIRPKNQKPLPLTASYRTAALDVFTPTEFSAEEIRVLGDFPDYAKLSGVPLPAPYHEFDINKARPRPYRPLRWAYHQTMCMSRLHKSDIN